LGSCQPASRKIWRKLASALGKLPASFPEDLAEACFGAWEAASQLPGRSGGSLSEANVELDSPPEQRAALLVRGERVL